MSKLKTVDIKGKQYVQVNDRIKYFRENFKGYSLQSEIISLDDVACVIRASILNEKQEIVAHGIAREKNGDSFINKTSYVENCETSAWGRALGNFGIGIDNSVASSDEVATAIENQNQVMDFETEKKKLKDLTTINEVNMFAEAFAKGGFNFKQKTEMRTLYTKKVNEIKETK